ncbi:zonular occludens toxin domain-containing protein [Pseudomonas sp. SG20056]|uniref:zonular occludens toxin domain-containing protein n=1 Tax=Pseudomonas sp. SG20056 TaxID=3074146 RepID=UPI00287FF1E3|nr:zonular occludens toxin domain-containing protein [Pseudomonas sp. SG20056]WNF48410.1 zonular occludens toxin domain-containing protein [Pseudomonas sp. SG20056]
MSIKIHHGPNGSYKTSGALQDDAIPAIKEGRTIITNIRGFTLDRVYEVFPDCPKSTEVINLSMESTEDLEKLRRWFMWAPKGAFLIFDETQILFPKSWRDKDLEQFDFPGGIEKAKEADRPTGWLDGWTRHRHWNWDVVLTTPNIRYIRDDIRLTCEKAYLHANLALIGVKGRYKEAMHDAQENRPHSDGSSIVELKKISATTFKLYDSTSTGTVRDTAAGKNLLLSPKVLGLLGFIAALLYSIFADDSASLFTNGLTHHQPQKPATAPAQAPGQTPAAPAGVAPDDLADRQTDQPAYVATDPPGSHPFWKQTLVVKAAMTGYQNERGKEVVLFHVLSEDGSHFGQTGNDLRALGYRITVITPCYVELRRDGWSGVSMCKGTAPAQQEAQAGTQAQQQEQLTAQQRFEKNAVRVTVIEDTSRDEKPFSN